MNIFNRKLPADASILDMQITFLFKDTQYFIIKHIPLGDTKPPGYINRRLKKIQNPANTAVIEKNFNPRNPTKLV